MSAEAGAQAIGSARPRTCPAGSERFYYGWVVLGVSTLAMIGTLPGRTQGLASSPSRCCAICRSAASRFAQINLVATLVGSLFCIGIGKLIDRTGSRIVLTVTALALGLTVLGMSQASGVIAMLDRGDVDARVRSERAVGGEPRDDRQVVPPPAHDERWRSMRWR